MIRIRHFHQGKLLQNSVGFIGLGQMGYPMASNLLKGLNPTEFYINDHSIEVASNFQKEHPSAKIASSPKQIAEKCSVIITMLPASLQVKTVYLGENGLLEGLKPRSLVIDSSTIDPSTTKEVFAILNAKQVSLLDAPVSGGQFNLFNGRYKWSKVRNFDFYGWCRK